MTVVLYFATVAKRSGAAEVYAVASRELEAVALGRLLLHLRRVEPEWHLPLKERRRLAVALLEEGVADRHVIDQTGISRTTLWRIRRDLVDRPRRPCEPAFQSGLAVSNRAPASNGSSGPILHAQASSGNGDFEALARLLGGVA
jgi:hypothetical protein